MTNKIIFGPRASELRKPQTEQACIDFVLGMGDSAMMCFDAIQYLVQDWCDRGGSVSTACGRVLDMERAEIAGESRIYDTEGKPIILERGKVEDIYLIRADDSFGASPRRCVGHMRAKRGQTFVRRVSAENLSRYFWIMVAMHIFEQDQNK